MDNNHTRQYFAELVKQNQLRQKKELEEKQIKHFYNTTFVNTFRYVEDKQKYETIKKVSKQMGYKIEDKITKKQIDKDMNKQTKIKNTIEKNNTAKNTLVIKHTVNKHKLFNIDTNNINTDKTQNKKIKNETTIIYKNNSDTIIAKQNAISNTIPIKNDENKYNIHNITSLENRKQNNNNLQENKNSIVTTKKSNAINDNTNKNNKEIENRQGDKQNTTSNIVNIQQVNNQLANNNITTNIVRQHSKNKENNINIGINLNQKQEIVKETDKNVDLTKDKNNFDKQQTENNTNKYKRTDTKYDTIRVDDFIDLCIENYRKYKEKLNKIYNNELNKSINKSINNNNISKQINNVKRKLGKIENFLLIKQGKLIEKLIEEQKADKPDILYGDNEYVSGESIDNSIEKKLEQINNFLANDKIVRKYPYKDKPDILK